MFHHRADTDERILRTYIESEHAFSETVPSLSVKLHVSSRTARRVLDRYAEIGMVQRRSLGRHIEPVYSRFQVAARAS